jgi:hypothetical protein
MAAFDYNIVAELVPTRSEVKSVLSRRRHRRASPLGYGRFASAADAIRFAIEELPPELLADAYLEVDEEIFGQDAIRRLYESDHYPLARRATTGTRMAVE